MKCRFAPSPTGKIHIGNARSAILNWIFCQKNQGEFVLRIDDTDANRSSKEFETSIKDDLKWLGLNWSYTFNQSSRQHIYNEKIQILKQKKRLYPCFETEEELALKKKSLLSSGKPPIYDRSSLNLSDEEVEKKIESGIQPHWRFKLDHENIGWKDIIKGDVSFDAKNLSDPVLIRADGTLLYHLPSVIDDIEEKITHIIRGEDHIANTAYHIQIFKALESSIPSFAHHPFLVDETGKGFSKRLGSLSIENFRDEGYENISLLNYFLFIGSSSNIDPIKDLNEIVKKFDIQSLSRSSAKFSIESLRNLNENTIKLFTYAEINHKLKDINLNFRNFWSVADYDEVLFKLKDDGYREITDYTLLESNPNTNFNIWNLDVKFQWWFNPGSNLIFLYRNQIFNRDNQSGLDYYKSLKNLFEIPVEHQISLRINYLIDANLFKKK